jgi:phage FluMu protein Com
VPSYINIIWNGDVKATLWSQGLLIEHLRSDILGILIVADKLCLQIDLDEYLKHQKQHREYKTATAIKEFRNLCDINSTVIIVLKDGVQEELQTAKEDVAVLASTVMGISKELVRWNWFLACTIKGKYTEKEQRFLNGMHNSITCNLIDKSIESVKKPSVPEYENITERIQSYPLAWRKENLEAIQNMSDAGFFYPGYGESGRCFHCGSFLANIRAHPMLLIFHAVQCPSCRYIENKLTKDEIKQATAKFRDEGNKPKEAELLRIKYQSLDARWKSFESYEKNNGKVSDNYIADLVEAGFYYFGRENLVHCFSCSVRICGIPNDQNVWSIHANLSPACSYVKTKKGGTFLHEQQTAKEQALNADCTSITFIMKTLDGTTRRGWPNNMIKPC